MAIKLVGVRPLLSIDHNMVEKHSTKSLGVSTKHFPVGVYKAFLVLRSLSLKDDELSSDRGRLASFPGIIKLFRVFALCMLIY